MKNAIIITALVSTVSACSSIPPSVGQSDTVFVVRNGDAKGGDISKHYNHLDQLWRSNVSVRIEADVVRSSATFYLAGKDACMANKDTVFRFHGPQNQALAYITSAVTVVPLPVSFQSPKKANNTRSLMAELYNHYVPGLGDWFMENAALKAGFAFSDLTAQEMHDKFNVPWC